MQSSALKAIHAVVAALLGAFVLAMPSFAQEQGPAELRSGHGKYVRIASVGAGDGFAGAELLANWYERNIRIFANIQRVAAPGERVLVIFGAGHAPILRELIEYDPALRLVEPNDWLPAPAAQTDRAHPVLALVGGRWFDGTRFEERTAYAVDGTLTDTPPARVDSVVELDGGWVVPPFGEAHNHNVEPSARIERVVESYLRDGVFYVANPNNLPGARDALAGIVNVPTGVDVVFANGGITAPGGHPEAHVAWNIERGVWTEAEGEGAFYFAVVDEAALDRAWDRVLAGRPDFVKTFLLYSEEYERRRDDPAFFGWRGLDPALLPEIVRRGHAVGLRVATHVETAADFHNALVAGVDWIAHMPGFRGDADVQLPDPSIFEIAESDARLAARLGTVVVTTVGGVREIDPAGPDGALRRRFDRLHARNLALLDEHGVRLALGSDSYDDTSVGEAMYLHGLGVLDERALLELWSMATPRAIFPDRRVGCLEEGCEASFLVLGGDPLADFTSVRDIRLRVKEGRVLDLGSEE